MEDLKALTPEERALIFGRKRILTRACLHVCELTHYPERFEQLECARIANGLPSIPCVIMQIDRELRAGILPLSQIQFGAQYLVGRNTRTIDPPATRDEVDKALEDISIEDLINAWRKMDCKGIRKPKMRAFKRRGSRVRR